MKFKFLAAAVVGLAAFSFVHSVSAVGESPQTKTSDTASAEAAADQQQKIDRVAAMDRKQGEISRRVGMSSCLEISNAGGEDFVAMAQEKGLIVEVTLDEVEAALKAAAATPQREDDLAAMNLAHWGSYRFFLDDKPAEAAPRP